MKKIFWVLLLVGIFGIFRSIQFNDKDNKLLNSSELGVFMNNAAINTNEQISFRFFWV